MCYIFLSLLCLSHYCRVVFITYQFHSVCQCSPPDRYTCTCCHHHCRRLHSCRANSDTRSHLKNGCTHNELRVNNDYRCFQVTVFAASFLVITFVCSEIFDHNLAHVPNFMVDNKCEILETGM